MTQPPLDGAFDTLPAALRAAGRQFATREAYVEGTRRLSFGDWIDQAELLAGALADRGVRAGDVLALMLPPSIDYAVAFAAGVLVGAVTTGLNTRLGPREVDAILTKCQPALVIRDEGLPPVPSGMAAMGRDQLGRLSSAGGVSDRRPGRSEGGPSHTGDPSDPVVIIWTSGTTGIPKGAWFDHRALAAAVTTAGVMTEPFDRRLVSTPFAHAGYMAKIWEQAAWGTAVVISPVPWRASDMLRIMVEERISVAGGVPTQWAKLLQESGLGEADLSCLRLGVAATAPAPPELVEAVTRTLGCPLVVRYAMTESPSISGTEPGDSPEVLYRTVGRPQAGVQIRIANDTPGDAVGRVEISSVCATGGYWKDPELTEALWTADGWLRSGDLGRIDEDGNLVLAGRASDMYIRGGYNVYPLEVENVLSEHPDVAQASVIGCPAPIIGEIGVAFVVPCDPSQPPDPEHLTAWCRARLTDYKVPDRILIVAELPLTTMLKVDKAALRTHLPG